MTVAVVVTVTDVPAAIRRPSTMTTTGAVSSVPSPPVMRGALFGVSRSLVRDDDAAAGCGRGSADGQIGRGRGGQGWKSIVPVAVTVTVMD